MDQDNIKLVDGEMIPSSKRIRVLKLSDLISLRGCLEVFQSKVADYTASRPVLGLFLDFLRLEGFQGSLRWW